MSAERCFKFLYGLENPRTPHAWGYGRYDIYSDKYMNIGK